MTQTRNVDDILATQGMPVDQVEVKEEVHDDKPVVEEAQESYLPEDEQVEAKDKSESESDTDEFGNKVTKSKLYTEEDVSNIVRERLKKVYAKEAEQKPIEQPVQQQTESSDGDWQTELDNHIFSALERKQQKEQQEAAQRREQELTAQFEEKFARGMHRYGDFADVVRGKPITDSMVIATRSMNDPAAFLYAAAKTQPQELERISKIQDPYAQIAEIGRLEERMKKVRAQTAASRPLGVTKGDVNNVGDNRRSIDELILRDAKRKLSRR